MSSLKPIRECSWILRGRNCSQGLLGQVGGLQPAGGGDEAEEEEEGGAADEAMKLSCCCAPTEAPDEPGNTVAAFADERHVAALPKMPADVSGK